LSMGKFLRNTLPARGICRFRFIAKLSQTHSLAGQQTSSPQMTSTRSITHVLCESGQPGRAGAGSMAHRLHRQASRLSDIETALPLLIAAEAPRIATVGHTAWLSSKGIFS
jgi:hypothetical protein